MNQAEVDAWEAKSADEKAAAQAAFIERMNAYVAPNPSPRNQKVSRDSSAPDKIEAQMQADGHRTWGYVIYRSTYENDADWEEFMHRLRRCAESEMEYYNGQDVLDLMTWTVFDDRSLFDGVSTSTIREHFKSWARSAVEAEQSPDGKTDVGMGLSPRYRYCIQVDSEALESVLKLPASPPSVAAEYSRWVKLIRKDWLPRHEDPVMRHQQPDPTEYEPVEGMIEEHVGWVKCPMSGVMVEYYQQFQDLIGYTVVERRPPAIIGYPWTS